MTCETFAVLRLVGFVGALIVFALEAALQRARVTGPW